MQSVTCTRLIDADPTSVVNAMSDLEPFMIAAGFDEVTVDIPSGDSQEATDSDGRAITHRIAVANQVGIATIELTLGVTKHPAEDGSIADAEPPFTLTYVQLDGIFESMTTRYTVTATDTGSEVTATTEFALDVAIVGNVLDATIIKRQRRRELAAQFDWIEAQVA